MPKIKIEEVKTITKYSCEYCGLEWNSEKNCIEHESECRLNPNVIEEMKKRIGKFYYIGPKGDPEYVIRVLDYVGGNNGRYKVERIYHRRCEAFAMYLFGLEIVYVNLHMKDLHEITPETYGRYVRYCIKNKFGKYLEAKQ